jgi:hypothetical protein
MDCNMSVTRQSREGYFSAQPVLHPIRSEPQDLRTAFMGVASPRALRLDLVCGIKHSAYPYIPRRLDATLALARS